jgi:hypothetical protein
MSSNPGGDFRKTAKHVPLPRNQFTIASFDMRQGSKAIDLQFKDELVGIERLDAA